MYSQVLSEFVIRETLPETYLEDAERYLVPLAQKLLDWQCHHKGPCLIGVNGAQGTGKSTLTALLTAWFQAENKKVANLSIDDFYLGQAQRRELGRRHHPLLVSRGVPGTHDIPLLNNTLQRLLAGAGNQSVPLPRFDKAVDDRVPAADWQVLKGPVDFVLLEGWFIGARAQTPEALAEPVNALESEEDPDGSWRRLVNEALARDYEPLFRRLQTLILLQAPSFEQVYAWRALQERKLRQASPADAPGLMDEQALARFIQHFERLTRHCLATLPDFADVVIRLDEDHRLVSCRYRGDAMA